MWALSSVSYFYNLWFEFMWVRGHVRGTKQFDGTWWPLERFHSALFSYSGNNQGSWNPIFNLGASTNQYSYNRLNSAEKTRIWSTFCSPMRQPIFHLIVTCALHYKSLIEIACEHTATMNPECTSFTDYAHAMLTADVASYVTTYNTDSSVSVSGYRACNPL